MLSGEIRESTSEEGEHVGDLNGQSDPCGLEVVGEKTGSVRDHFGTDVFGGITVWLLK